MTEHRFRLPGGRQYGSDETSIGFPSERAVHPFVYLGVVMDARDVERMGRLRVWIPELSGQAGRMDESKWITAVYASPFAGTSNWMRLSDTERWQDSQQAYGFWAVPPDVGNEVLVAFIAGDPHRAVWFGCLWPSFANHSVPGISRGPTMQPLEESCEEQPPTVEVNRSPDTSEIPVGAGDFYGNPERPRFDPLHEGLWRQGLYGDHLRGNANSSARRETPSNVFGVISPRGHHVVIDDGLPELDDEGNPVYDGTQRLVRDGSAEYIRLRTRSGTQILISDTDGFVYIITRDGNSWVEISDDGIFTYTLGDYNLRVQGNMNVRVDGDYNLEVVGRRTERTVGPLKVHGEDRVEIVSARVGDCSGDPAVLITSEEDVMINAGRDGVVTVGRRLDRSAGERIADVAPAIHHNDVDVAGAEAAEPTEPERRDDVEIDPDECYPTTDIECDSILAQEAIVTHEPWAHPRTTVLDPDEPEEVEQEPDEPEPEIVELVEDCVAWEKVVETVPVHVPVEPGVAAEIRAGTSPTVVAADVRALSAFADDPTVLREAERAVRASTPYLDRPVRDSRGRWLVGWGTEVPEQTARTWESLSVTERRRVAESLLRQRLRSILAVVASGGDTLATRGQVASATVLGYHRGASDPFFRRLLGNLAEGEYAAFVTGVACTGLRGGTDVVTEPGEPAGDTGGAPPEAPTPDSDCPSTTAPPTDPAVTSAIDGAASEWGVDRDYLYATAWIESGFRPDAAAGTSSASGLFQITRDTFERTVAKYPDRLRHPDGTPYTWADRFDPEVNARVAAALTADNAASLRRELGRDPTPSELYAAHLLGVGNAAKLLRASPDADPYRLFGPRSREIVDNNPLIFRRGEPGGPVLTAGETKNWIATLVERCGSGVVPA